MKRLFLATLLFFACAASRAQLIVYNGTFDSVITDGQGHTVPVNWTVADGLGGESTTDAHSGPYAVRIYNFSYFAKGQLFYGHTSSPEYTGMTLLDVPTALHGYYKYILGQNSGGSDSAEVSVNVTHFNQMTGATDTVKSGKIYLTPSFSYVPFTVPIQSSVEQQFCDTLRIQFTSSVSGACDSASDGTCCFLYVDDISLEFPNGVETAIGSSRMPALVYDAAADRFQLMAWDSRNTPWSLSLVDATGREVLHKPDLRSAYASGGSGLAAGIYLYRVDSEGKRLSGKIVLTR